MRFGVVQRLGEVPGRWQIEARFADWESPFVQLDFVQERPRVKEAVHRSLHYPVALCCEIVAAVLKVVALEEIALAAGKADAFRLQNWVRQLLVKRLRAGPVAVAGKLMVDREAAGCLMEEVLRCEVGSRGGFVGEFEA